MTAFIRTFSTKSRCQYSVPDFPRRQCLNQELRQRLAREPSWALKAKHHHVIDCISQIETNGPRKVGQRAEKSKQY
jgi:hypothetical protein